MAVLILLLNDDNEFYAFRCTRYLVVYRISTFSLTLFILMLIINWEDMWNNICKYNPPWQIPYIYIYTDTSDIVWRYTLYCLHHMPENVNIQETIPKFCHCCRLFGDCTAFTEFSIIQYLFKEHIFYSNNYSFYFQHFMRQKFCLKLSKFMLKIVLWIWIYI